jgi:hypothetical protein
VPGAKERYVSFTRFQQCCALQKSIEDSQAFIAQSAEQIRELQRRLNTARCSYQRWNEAELENKIDGAVKWEFERLLALEGVTGLALEGDSLVLKAAVRYEYQGVWYDFGDWSLNLSWDESSNANKWLSREIRRGFKDTWMVGDRSHRYPVYRLSVGVFCFGDLKGRIEEHLRFGRLAEGIELALACMHFVNPDDLDKIPQAFWPVAESPGAIATASAATAALTFVPNREMVVHAYARLRTEMAQFKLLSARMKLGVEIAECESQLNTIKEQRAQHEEKVACEKQRAQNPDTEFLSKTADEFERDLNYLKSLTGVTDIDFCDGGMVVSVLIRFIQGSAFYDFGDWNIYLGGERNVVSQGFNWYRIENRCPPDAELPKAPFPLFENHIDLTASLTNNNTICDCVKAGRYLEAAALTIADMHSLGEQRIATMNEQSCQT